MGSKKLAGRQVKICDIIFRLDHIPAYRRMYKVTRIDGKIVASPPKWTWMRNGLWGTHILDGRLDWYWPYLNTMHDLNNIQGEELP